MWIYELKYGETLDLAITFANGLDVDADIKIKMEGGEHLVTCYHSQSIEKLADNFVAVAHDEQGTIEAFKHDTLPIYGIVWHPERMTVPVLPKEVKKLFD